MPSLLPRLQPLLYQLQCSPLARMVRDLKGTLEREDASIGLFITLEESTEPMREEAATAGLFHSELWNRDYQRIQLLSIRELLEGKKPSLPPFVLAPYQQAEKLPARKAAEQRELFGQG